MKSREVDWVRFNDGTKAWKGVHGVDKIIYYEDYTHFIDVIFNNGEVHRIFGIDGVKFKKATTPNTDITEVVRCKNCAKRDKNLDLGVGVRCKEWGCVLNENDFCSFGVMDDDK